MKQPSVQACPDGPGQNAGKGRRDKGKGATDAMQHSPGRGADQHGDSAGHAYPDNDSLDMDGWAPGSAPRDRMQIQDGQQDTQLASGSNEYLPPEDGGQPRLYPLIGADDLRDPAKGQYRFQF